MHETKQAKIMRKLERHLRKTSRQLIKIDTEEEAIQFLIDSFKTELYCDFVGVVLAEDNQFVSKAWEGQATEVRDAFPLKIAACFPKLLEQSLKDEDAEKIGDCELTANLKKSAVQTWFTVPLIDGEQKYGFCLVGFYIYVPLLEMYQIFDEFGKDVAVAIAMARRKDRQLKEFDSIEWIKNFSLDNTLEENVSGFTSRAAQGLNAKSACFYFYDEKKGYFYLQNPVYGEANFIEKVYVNQKAALKEYFPYLEKVGEHQLTMPIVVDLKTIGVIHVKGKVDNTCFTTTDRQMLRLLSDYIAVLLENMQLYNKEKEQRERLQLLLDYQHALVKETVVHDDFHGITNMLSDIFNCSVVLLDRFLRPLSFNLLGEDEENIADVLLQSNFNQESTNIIKQLEEKDYLFSIWSIDGVRSRLGYLLLGIDKYELDEFDELTVNIARNISSIQFIKKKLVFNANEQAKEALMGKLLIEQIEDEKSIIQYASLFQWDIYQSHRVASVSIELSQSDVKSLNLLERNMKKSLVWDHIIDRLVTRYKGILTATFEEHYLLIIPEDNKAYFKDFWSDFFNNIKESALKSEVACEVYLGIGKKVNKMNEYYTSYKQALQVVNVVQSRFKMKGYALFEDLGSYTILYQLDHPVVEMFMENQLGTLITYSEENNIDLVNTLRVYLQNNGNAKSTAEKLYMHRSSFIYRLEKIESLLGIDLNDSDTRFNLMMAFKLFDMKGTND